MPSMLRPLVATREEHVRRGLEHEGIRVLEGLRRQRVGRRGRQMARPKAHLKGVERLHGHAALHVLHGLTAVAQELHAAQLEAAGVASPRSSRETPCSWAFHGCLLGSFMAFLDPKTP